ncbi:amp dependent CoA ligase [Wilcoxina mikolae CBS 423.85]|nr:amp dependent CoA ligase [Wilcoxina mikolae CBS 423.85]
MTPGFFQAHAELSLPGKDILSWMFDSPRYDLNKTIYISANDPSRSLTGAQCKDIICRLAKGLRDAGLKKGDVVMLHSFNDINYPLIVLGTIAAGGIWTGSNPAYTPAELAHHIRGSAARFIISEPEILPAIRAAGDTCDIPAQNYWIFDNLPTQTIPAGYRSWRALLANSGSDWVRFNDLETSAATTAMRLFSSGTTGLPKAANISHLNLIAQHTVVLEHQPKDYEAIYCFPLPLFHAASAPSVHVSKLRSGSRTYILRRFDLEMYLRCIRDFKITEVTVVPPLVVAMVMSPICNSSFFTSIRSATSGAAPLGLLLQRRFQALLPKETPMKQVWGMTETTCVATMFWPGEFDDTGSVGYLVPGLEAKLVDDEGNEVKSYNNTGEMCVRGKTIFQGYYNNPEANRELFDNNGFYKTGDIMYCDGASKKWYIVDRKKELIKVRGFQVVPPELESTLLSHPEIIDAAVIGVTNSDGEELPRAYVVKRPGATVTAEDVFDFCRQRLASYKRLDGGVVFLDAIPKNSSGKILKKTLREWAKKEGMEGGSKL